MSTTVGHLKAQFDLSARNVGTQVRGIGAQFRQMRSELVSSVGQIHPALGTLTNAMSGPAGLVGAAAAAGYAFKRLMAESEEITSAADRLGMGTEMLERLREVARRTGTSFGTVSSAWQRMQVEISRAQGGGGRADFFEQMGLSPEKLRAMAPEEAFVALARAIAQVENKTDRARLQYEIFGRSGVELDAVLRRVAGGLGDIGVVSAQSRQEMADLENQWLDLKREAMVGAKEIVVGIARGTGEVIENVREMHATFRGGGGAAGLGLLAANPYSLQNWRNFIGGGAEGLRDYIDARDQATAADERARQGAGSDTEALEEQNDILKTREQILQRVKQARDLAKFGEGFRDEMLMRDYEAAGGDRADLEAILDERNRILEAQKQEKRFQDEAKRRQDEAKRSEEERLSVLRQLREEAERLFEGEENYALRNLTESERAEAQRLQEEIRQLRGMAREDARMGFAGAAERGSAEARTAILQYQRDNPAVKLQERGNEIARDGFQRVEDAVRNAKDDDAKVAAAPFN